MPIFDQGYQHWSGTLSGHFWRWFVISRQGVRVGMKNIFLRLLVIASWFPAAILAFMLCAWGLLEQKSRLVEAVLPVLAMFFPPEMISDPKHYRVEVWELCFHYFMRTELWVSMIVVLLVGPGLISLDLRFNALPLYFSRPLRRIDYFAGKLGVIGWFLSLVIILPSLIAYGLGLLFSLDVSIIWDTFPVLLASIGYGAIIVLSAGTLILALSSLSRNSRFIALGWVTLWFVSGFVSFVLDVINEEQQRYAMYQRENAEAMQAPRQANRQARSNSREQFARDQMEQSRSDWRPLVSYAADLGRIGQELLNVSAAKRRLNPLYAPTDPDESLQRWLDPQYPWYWSAAVLAVLFGLSACILNFRIRSLDRLR
jgi:ABC-2 type transport system permease protein